MASKLLQEFAEESEELDAGYRVERSKIEKDATLSPVGKAQAIAALESKRNAQLEALQGRARRELTARQAKVAQEVGKLVSARTDDLRRTVGDVVAADIIRRRIEVASNGQLADWFSRQMGDWERSIVTEFGDIELERRRSESMFGDSAVALDYTRASAAWNALQGDDQTETLRAEADVLRDVESIVADLDVATVRTRLAGALGLPERYLTEVQPAEFAH